MLKFITSYGPKGGEQIRRFLPGFREFCPSGSLRIFVNDQPIDLGEYNRHTTSLDHMSSLRAFREMLHKKRDGTGEDLIRSAEKWFYKVLSLHIGVSRAMLGETVVWIDSDVMFKNGLPPHSWWAEVLPGDRFEVATLMRPRHARAETGWLAVRVLPATQRLFDELLDVFVSGTILGMEERNEAYVLPLLMHEHRIRVLDLARKVDHKSVGLHVWPHSPLGLFMDHHKGPKRKTKAYGG